MRKKMILSSLTAAIALGGIGYSLAQQDATAPGVPTVLPGLPTDPFGGPPAALAKARSIAIAPGLPTDPFGGPPAAVEGYPLQWSHHYQVASRASSEADTLVAKWIAAFQKAGDESTKSGIVSKLTDAVGKQFDSRQAARDKELKQLEDQLVKLKAVHNKRTAQKDRIVKDRVQQLINNVEGIGWGTDVPADVSFAVPQMEAASLDVLSSQPGPAIEPEFRGRPLIGN